MTRRTPQIVTLVVMLAVWVGATAGQDKSTVRVPDGLAMSDFSGYETWQVVAISQTDELLNVIMANPAMIDAYRAGIPGNGKPFPDGARSVKVQWRPKKNPEAPFSVNVPDTLKNVAFMAKDAKRFSDSGGWGYANFNYEAASNSFTPDGKGTGCGFACHSRVKAKDYVFTAFGKR